MLKNVDITWCFKNRNTSKFVKSSNSSDDEEPEDEGTERVGGLSDGYMVLVEMEPVKNTQKSQKQNQITDLFVKQ